MMTFPNNHEIGAQNMWWHKETPEEVRMFLGECWSKKYPVRLWFGKRKGDHIGHAWGDEWDVLGRIGKSGGSMPVPLLVTYPPIGDGYSGEHILDNCVIRIDAFITSNHEMYWSTMYEFEHFSLPEYVVDWEVGDKVVKVLADQTHVASFKTHLAAYLYIAFMTGASHEQGYLGLESDGD